MPAPLLPNPRRTSVLWADLLEPDAERRDGWAVCSHPPRLVACGETWDAVVITPLERGLAALDRLSLPREAGYPVLADYIRRQLIVQVPVGTAHHCDAPGSRMLSAETWLLVPDDRYGTASATWLSAPGPLSSRLVDAALLCRALRDLDASFRNG
ncbi:hypothetical protein [Streptomyces vilmorinianum]|uniref:hypothetical protein n=1 Tax=Streptomyces vilmorinianum TaxID=3051092 RepID=UPI0010FAF229|nr:hypothetical protein [Streptomyces vilmorinianum]